MKSAFDPATLRDLGRDLAALAACMMFAAGLVAFLSGVAGG